MRKRISAKYISLLLLSICLLFTGIPACSADETWQDHASTSWYNGSGAPAGTVDDPYMIATAQELAGLAKLVKESSSNFSGKFIKLTGDIDLKNLEWVPIGRFMNNFNNYGFAGTFDGNGHAVKGLLVTKVSNASSSSMQSECPGLFGYLTSAGCIKNVYAEGTVKGNTAQGAAVLVTWNTGKITNCVVSGDITAEGSSRGYAGGIAAVSNGGVIRNCIVYGSYQAKAGWMNYPAEFVGYASQAAQTKFYNCIGLADKAGSGISGGMISSFGEKCYWLKEDSNANQPASAGTAAAVKITSEAEAPVSSVLLDPDSMTQERVINRSYDLVLAAYPKSSPSADIKCAWKFDDSNVKTASSGGIKVTINSPTEGKKYFTAKITGINGITEDDTDNALILRGCITIGVIPITALSLDKSEIEIEKGAGKQLIYSVSPTDTTDTDFIWTSSNESVAKVDADGLVIGMSAGSAVITLKAGGFTAECSVTVKVSEDNIAGEIPSGQAVPDGAEAVMPVAVSFADSASAGAAIGAGENDIADKNGVAYLAEQTAETGAGKAVENAVAQGDLPEKTTVSSILRLPLFTAEVKTKGTLAVMAFSLSGAQLLAETPKEVKLVQVRFDEGSTTGIFFRYADNADEYTDGHFTLQDYSGNILGASDKINADDRYKLILYVQDNGNFDLDAREKSIMSPTAIVQTSGSADSSGASGSSGGGCNTGTGLLLILAFAPCLLICNKKGRKK